MPKYILVHDETTKMAIMECNENEISEIANEKTGFYILRSYQETPIKKYRVYGVNEDGNRWNGFIYSTKTGVESVFHDIYPNDMLESYVEHEV